MVLFAIVGELGAGKTLTLTYLAYINHLKGRKIFANYRLYGIPFVPVKSLEELDAIRKGFCAFDELWIWLDARASGTKKNRIVSNILARSRKRGLTIAFTTQTLRQVDRRIREVIDFVAYPILNRNNTICTVLVFMGQKMKILQHKFRFLTAPIFRMYDTEEEVGDLEEFRTEEEKPKVELKEVFYPPRQI